MNLDHVAIAAPDVTAALGTLVTELGALERFGGYSIGFRSMQVRLGDDHEGMTVELLEPWQAERFDFLARFLARHGEGPHHITFKVDDIARELDRLRGEGYELVNVSLDNPWWKEAFFMPRDAHGTVVQIAQSAHDHEDILEMLDEHGGGGEWDEKWWTTPPEPADGTPAVTLRRVVLASPALPDAVAFFGGVLRGETAGKGDGWVELEWPSGAHVRIESRDDRAPGIDRLEGDHDGPPAERTIAGARFVLLAR